MLDAIHIIQQILIGQQNEHNNGNKPTAPEVVPLIQRHFGVSGPILTTPTSAPDLGQA